ncbi:MAG TPA: hypothetical protein VFA09_00920 [Ktedonobacteraceae bacterium]|nr:hypothetical protein [Ktedonobacteraceae bacterium]
MALLVAGLVTRSLAQKSGGRLAAMALARRGRLIVHTADLSASRRYRIRLLKPMIDLAPLAVVVC